ncbi:MAG: SDR family oxidoreductase [Desulfobacterales bacterium]|nr:SDR family oxidoreductase [Desulfobacterales bacterium]
MVDFKGKRAYITGGSSGIGLAVAKRLASMGAHVAIFSRNEEKLDAALNDVREAGAPAGAQAAAFRLDVASNAEVERVLAEAASAFGPTDFLINSAGMSQPDYFENIGHEDFERILRVNFMGTRSTVAAVLPHMHRQRSGYIVNVASVAGFVGVFGFTSYCASKFAVIGFSEALRGELRPRGIGVSVLCPPDTDTPMLRAENVIKPAETLKISEGGGLLTADQVARAMIDGIRRRRFMIIPGAGARFTWLAKRLVPGLVFAVMDRDVRTVQKKRIQGAQGSRGPG